MSPITHSWAQVPPLPQYPARGLRHGARIAATVVLLLPTLCWAVVTSDSRVAASAAVVLPAAAILATAMLRRTTALIVMPLAFAAAAGSLSLIDRPAAIATLVSVILVEVAVGGVATSAAGGQDRSTTAIPALTLGAVATVGAASGRVEPMLVPLVSALVVTFVVRSSGDRFGTLVGRFAAAVGTIVSVTTFGALGLVVVVLPGIAHRLLRVDPFVGQRHRQAGFIPRERRTGRPERPWIEDPVADRPTVGVRFRRALVGPLVVAILVSVAGGAYVVRRGIVRDADVGTTEEGPLFAWQPDPSPAAMAGAEWWPEYQRELGWIFEGGVFDPFRLPRMHDITSRFTNVVDGDRVSWSAPACECQRLTVWIYGGSTIFGLGQRDDHTIPSEIAQLAWDDDIALDVVNRGVPGDLHWQEANRFAWDVAAEPAPDLVLFYDGFNDLVASAGRNNDGEGDNESPTDQVIDRLLREGVITDPATNENAVEAPEWASVVTAPVVQLPPDELARHAVNRYETSRHVSGTVAEANDVPAMWFWQPTVRTRIPVEGDVVGDPAGVDWSRTLFGTASDLLPADVHDLGKILDSSPDPLFYDEVHTNEQGARIVAAEILRIVRPTIDRLLDKEASR